MKWVKGNGRFEYVSDKNKKYNLEETIYSKDIEVLEKIREASYYDCVRCHASKVCKNRNTTCPDCLESNEYQKTIKQDETIIAYKSFREPVAFLTHQESGKQVAIDKNGHKFDPSETRYNLKDDPHGWRATGKRVAKYDINGNPIT